MADEKKRGGFADLFEKEAKAMPARARRVEVGDRLKATVVQVGRDAVFVELDGKRQAWLDAAELRAPDGTMSVKVGDELEAHVVAVDASGDVQLGRTLARGSAAGLAAIEQAKDSGIPIEGKVTGVNKGGLEVDLAGVRAFCPISQADVRYVEDPPSLIGRSLRFAVTEVRDGGRSVVLSRRAVLEAEGREARDRALSSLGVGAIVRGTVTSVREFGAFVDLGGIEGLIPVSELSHERGIAAADVVSAGDVVDVQVRDVKHVSGDPPVKITLSLKALAADPWDAIDTVAPIGTAVDGTVTRIADFGAFVRLGPGIEGLLHVSEMGGKADHAAQRYRVGQAVTVVVKSVDKTAKRIALVPAPEGAAAGSAVRGVSVAVGQIVHGTVDRVETYGVFVQVEGTKGRAGRGLIPNAELGTARGSDTRKLFPEGAKVTAKVLETGDGRIRLSIKAIKEDEERSEFDGYRERSAAPARLGTLGDLLKKK